MSFYDNVLSFCLFCVQGSEIFTVFAKDGDQNSPSPIHYSILNGQLRYCFSAHLLSELES